MNCTGSMLLFRSPGSSLPRTPAALGGVRPPAPARGERHPPWADPRARARPGRRAHLPDRGPGGGQGSGSCWNGSGKRSRPSRLQWSYKNSPPAGEVPRRSGARTGRGPSRTTPEGVEGETGYSPGRERSTDPESISMPGTGWDGPGRPARSRWITESRSDSVSFPRVPTASCTPRSWSTARNPRRSGSGFWASLSSTAPVNPAVALPRAGPDPS